MLNFYCFIPPQVSKKFFNIAQFPGAVDAIDCSRVPLSPGRDDAERFRNRKGYFSINTQTVVSADLSIQNVVARWPGSTHDSTILANSTLPELMQNPILQHYHLIGDSGYPCRPYIMTPLTRPITQAEKRHVFVFLLILCAKRISRFLALCILI